MSESDAATCALCLVNQMQTEHNESFEKASQVATAHSDLLHLEAISEEKCCLCPHESNSMLMEAFNS